MCIDEFNGDNFDHGPLGFVGGGYLGQVQTNGRPIETTPVPAGTPKPVSEFLHRETVKVMSMPDTREKLAAMGFDPVASTPEEFAQWIRTEIVRWGKVIRDANIALQ